MKIHIPKRWLSIIIASVIYIMANVLDCFLTLNGISRGKYNEGNPVIQGYIDHFGLTQGVIIYKAYMCFLIITGVVLFELISKKRRFKFEYILHLGTILTLIAGILWLV